MQNDFGTPLEGPKRKHEFVNQSHSTKIVKKELFCVFEIFFFFEESKNAILVSVSAHEFLLIISITFFD